MPMSYWTKNKYISSGQHRFNLSNCFCSGVGHDEHYDLDLLSSRPYSIYESDNNDANVFYDDVLADCMTRYI